MCKIKLSKKYLPIFIFVFVVNIFIFNIASAAVTGVSEFGSVGSGDGQFNNHTQMAVDSSNGNLYIADTGNNRIQKFDSSGTFILKWGSSGTGNGQFTNPKDVALDSAGNVYVLDNTRVQKFDASGNFIASYNGSSQGGSSFASTYDLAIDSNGYVYVSQFLSGYKIQVFDADFSFVEVFDGNDKGGTAFSSTVYMEFDGLDNLYVNAGGTIQKFDSNLDFVTSWTGAGNGGLGVTASGDVYTSQSTNTQIRKYTSAGAFVTSFSCFGSGITCVSGPSDIDFYGQTIYVVEQGSSYANERVNLFTDTDIVNAPLVITLSPADNAVDVELDTDLTLTFNMDVGWESGNILIKKAEDDSVYETIEIGGGPISGSGTDTLTFNPQNDFEYDTEYYVEIPNTAIRDITEGIYFEGISGATTWSFTTVADEVAPILTESIAIPDPVPLDNDGIYYFQTNEVCDVQVTATSSTTGFIQVLSELADEIDTDIGITLDGMQLGGTYSFSFNCIDDAENESNTLTVGPFTLENVPEPEEEVAEVQSRSTSRSGSSMARRVKNLLSLGKTERANELISEYPNAFDNQTVPQTTSNIPSTTQTTIIPVRDLELGIEGLDVKALQQLLNTQGFLVAETGVGSIGNETDYFGTLTQNALAKYQAANNIAPAVGYFGPITRAQMKSAGLVGLWW